MDYIDIDYWFSFIYEICSWRGDQHLLTGSLIHVSLNFIKINYMKYFEFKRAMYGGESKNTQDFCQSFYS